MEPAPPRLRPRATAWPLLSTTLPTTASPSQPRPEPPLDPLRAAPALRRRYGCEIAQRPSGRLTLLSDTGQVPARAIQCVDDVTLGHGRRPRPVSGGAQPCHSALAASAAPPRAAAPRETSLAPGELRRLRQPRPWTTWTATCLPFAAPQPPPDEPSAGSFQAQRRPTQPRKAAGGVNAWRLHATTETSVKWVIDEDGGWSGRAGPAHAAVAEACRIRKLALRRQALRRRRTEKRNPCLWPERRCWSVLPRLRDLLLLAWGRTVRRGDAAPCPPVRCAARRAAPSDVIDRDAEAWAV